MNPFGMAGQLFRRNSDYQQITSPALSAELADVLARTHLQERLLRFTPHREYAEVLRTFEDAEVIDDPPIVKVCRDHSDDKFFPCAVAGRADYIVSEDEDILAIDQYEGVRTIRTATFLVLLDERSR